MKIELVRTVEPDGIWYKILEDGKNIKCFGCNHVPEESARASAEEWYESAVKRGKEPKFDIIKSIEI